jgi:hypothetical protein
MVEKRNTYKFLKRIHTKFWQDKPKKRAHLEGIGIDGRIILKYNTKKEENAWTAFVRVGIGQLSVLGKMVTKRLVPYIAEHSIIRRRPVRF